MKNKISIITVTKNSKKYIKDTIDSVINQYINKENLNFELEYIIHDGNSTDGTLEIIKSYSIKYNFIKFSSFEDTGLFDGLAHCLPLVTGNLVAYINSGDLYHINSFQLISDLFTKNKNINWLTGSKFFYNENSEIIDFYKPYLYRKNLIKSGVYGKYLPFIQQESTFWRSDLNKLIDLEYLRTLKLSGDYFIWFSFSFKEELYIINSFLSGFKFHSNQLTFKETGKTDIYLNEIKKFKKKIKLHYFFYILIDGFFWFILKHLQNFITKNSPRQIYFNKKLSTWIFDKNKKIFCWVTELNSNQGEGILGKMYLDSISESYNIFDVKTPNNFFSIKNKSDLDKFNSIDYNLNKSFKEKYYYPIMGLFICWYKFLRGNKIIYVNYLPLWNIFIFMLSPPKTTFGPITGSIFKGKPKNFEEILRKYVMPILFRISLIFLKIRNRKYFFSTENLKEILPKYILKKSKFNYFLNNIKIKNNLSAKDIDFIIYNRPYPSKNNKFIESLTLKLSEKFKVYVVGEEIYSNKIKNLGKIAKEELLHVIARSKFTILSAENFSSLFARDCFISNTNIFYNKNNIIPKIFENNLNKKIYPLNYDNLDDSYNLIIKQSKLFDQNKNYTLTDYNLNKDIIKEIN